MSGRLKLPGRYPRPRSVLVLAVAALAVVAVIAVLTVTGTGTGHAGPKGPAPVAKSFRLGELGHPGSHVSLAAVAGRPVVLNFFASWCAPCKRETPLLAKFYAEHHGKIPVIGIDANDQTAAALKFVRKDGVGYPVGVDPFPAATATSYGVLALPQTFFLNAQHRIVRHIVGDLTARELSSWAAGAAGSSKQAAASGAAHRVGNRS
jgi:thiol-disulfide isomerase/thioredoxin